MLHTIIVTFPTNQSASVLEVFEEEEGGVVVKVDDGGEGHCAVKRESDEPR